jgi:hypothetical protein
MRIQDLAGISEEVPTLRQSISKITQVEQKIEAVDSLIEEKVASHEQKLTDTCQVLTKRINGISAANFFDQSKKEIESLISESIKVDRANISNLKMVQKTQELDAASNKDTMTQLQLSLQKQKDSVPRQIENAIKEFRGTLGPIINHNDKVVEIASKVDKVLVAVQKEKLEKMLADIFVNKIEMNDFKESVTDGLSDVSDLRVTVDMMKRLLGWFYSKTGEALKCVFFSSLSGRAVD